MALKAERKWEVLRALHEHYRVPFSVLAVIGQVEIDFVDRIAVQQKWTTGMCAATLQVRLALAFDDQLKKLATNECDDATAEKRAKALQAMAKTLESIAGLENCGLSHSVETAEKNTKRLNDKLPMDEERLQKLNQDLEILVTKIEQDRGVG